MLPGATPVLAWWHAAVRLERALQTARGLEARIARRVRTMAMVDSHIGSIVDALLPEVAGNTAIVFSSDHGEYAGAHGFTAGKVGSVYDEAFHVPLIVVGGTGRFAGDIATPREGLTSSVDVPGLLVSLGHNGGRDWITADLAQPYARQHDLTAMLRSAAAPGRPYRSGTRSTPGDPRVPHLRDILLTGIIGQELRGPIAPQWRAAQQRSERAFLRYQLILNGLSRRELSFGGDF